MLPTTNLRPASRTVVYGAVGTALVTTIAFCLAYVLVSRDGPTGAQALVWIGMATLLLEFAVTAWCVRAVKAIEEDEKRQQIQFFAKAIHDVRQPLQAATLFIDSLVHASPGPKMLKAAQCLDQSIQSVRHTLDSLLDISRLNAGAVPVRKQAFSLITLLNALETEFAAQATSRNLRFCLYCPPTDVWVNSDPQLVQMILRNLLVQAMGETQRGGILLGARKRASQVIIQVWDTRTKPQGDPGVKPGGYRDIANRVASLIQSPLISESKTGRGAVCSLALSLGETPPITTPVRS
jgi:signal transduction histidine kinase